MILVYMLTTMFALMCHNYVAYNIQKDVNKDYVFLGFIMTLLMGSIYFLIFCLTAIAIHEHYGEVFLLPYLLHLIVMSMFIYILHFIKIRDLHSAIIVMCFSIVVPTILYIK